MTTVTRWNPVREVLTLREAMDHLFNESYYRRGSDYQTRPSAWQLPVDAYSNEDAIVLVADVPGLKPEDLEVTLEGDTLTIRGELKNHAEERNYVLRERAAGNFERIMTVNTPIDANKVEAVFEDGVLTLTLPKAEAAKPKQIQVKATNGNGKK